ncbi:Aldo-keto reductase-like protein 19 [Elsinoe fawcettii]|nr:Aldo-keto reductase-like protein 19 [Elsinoe fawcettii]
MPKLTPKAWPDVKNNSPVALPAIALGTWEGNKENRAQLEDAVINALEAGYRHIDTAALYGSEPAVGNAIKRSSVPRKDIVVVTKIWNTHHSPEAVKASLEESLGRLQLDYVDLLLLHWPVAFKHDASASEPYTSQKTSDGKPVLDMDLTEDHAPSWRALEELVSTGKVKSIGVSNFTIPQLTKLLSYAKVKPACNQVEVHPWFPQNKMLDFCRKHDITVTAFSPLGGQRAVREGAQRVIEDPVVVEAAKKLDLDPAQVIIAWAVQRGTVPLPKSATPSRIKSNFEVPELPKDVFEAIENITVNDPSKKNRFCNFDDSWAYPLFKDQD